MTLGIRAAGTQPVSSDPESAIVGVAPLALTQLSALSASDADRDSDVSIKKRKRVRTGCFTCRDRHLKCDAAHGQCLNCRKSGRQCRRGVRLNFFDTQVLAPPTYLKPPKSSSLTFRDDSRVIASEYVGGDEVYPPLEEVEDIERQTSTPVQLSGPDLQLTDIQFPLNRDALVDDPTAMSLMQVFVTQIAPWLDVVDGTKHFTRILPLYAVEDPLLRAAFSACAGCYTSLGHPDEGNERLHHFHTAVQLLALSLTTFHNDQSLCAAATVIIEIADMLVLGPIESAMQIRSTNSARSLIRENQWNTCTQGLGGTLSWLSILMELLDCISLRQTLVWDPDTWGIDMAFTAQPSIIGSEEAWLHQIINICAKVSEFRSSQNIGTRTRKAETQRAQQWSLYNERCNKWLASIPRSMLPLGNAQPWQRHPQSVFPQVWILERSAIIAYMLYHITRIMLLETDTSKHHDLALQEEQQRIAYKVCGIMSNGKSSGIPIFSAQLFGIAAGYLVDDKAQEEALSILHQIRLTTGLNTEHIRIRLQETWGHHQEAHEPPETVDSTTVPMGFHASDHDPMFHDPAMVDSFSHSLAETGPFLGHHFHYDQP